MSHVLVVDDDPVLARLVTDILGQDGHRVSRAGTGERALEFQASESIDLVLLDMRLPGMGGLATCTRLRECAGSGLPILMMTAYADPLSVRQCYEAGADDVLSKPIDRSLSLKVRASLRQKALHDENLAAQREAQARVRDLALLHEIGRDWSLIAEPGDFHRMVTERLAGLIGAKVCLIALYDPAARSLATALPAFGLADAVAHRLGYQVLPEHRNQWNFRTGRPYMSNRARSDPRLLPEMVDMCGADSLVLVPMLAAGNFLGLLVAANKPGGFRDADVQLLTIFAGPAASFLRSRQIFERQRLHASRLEQLSDLVGQMAGSTSRTQLLELTVTGVQKDFGYDRVAFLGVDEAGAIPVEASAGVDNEGDPDLLRWALRGALPLQSADGVGAEIAIPVRAGESSLGLLHVLRLSRLRFDEEEVNLLTTLGGQLAVALQKTEGLAQTQRLAGQLATLYDVGLQTAALRDLRGLFTKATEEAGRLIKADHTSVLRLEDDTLRMFAAWARDPSCETYAMPTFRLGEGVAGRVAQDRVPALVNQTAASSEFVARGNPVARLCCVPLVYYDQEVEDQVVFGVLNATRRAGAARFTSEDLEYLTRFAGQLSIAVANSMAFAAERERSEQLALVNAVLREIAGSLSRDRILETAVRRIQEAFKLPVALAVIPEPDGINRIAFCAGSRPRRQQGDVYPAGSALLRRVLSEKRTVREDEPRDDPERLEIVPGIRSELMVPILSGGEVVAILDVESDDRRAFDRGTIITLETLADGVSIIWRNAELYQALEETNARLVEIDRMRTEVVNLVAHDFRSPLAGVLGHAELLEWKPDAPRLDRIEQARHIIHAATHMARLVDKTLTTTRLDTGHFPFDFGRVDLCAIARDVAARLPLQAKHPLRLELPAEPLPCWADGDRVAEVLDNLLSNAIKYSPDGGEVCVTLRREGDSARLCVADQGLGIDIRDQERLFRPFSRVRNSRTAGIEGSGLGLYICARLVRAHGGTLNLASVAGEGSTFVIDLPLLGSESMQDAPLILVASGDEHSRRQVCRAAEEQGYAVSEVRDGVEAVEAALRLMPAAVVLDRVLPRLGAGEVAERLREHTVTESVPLLSLANAADLGEWADLFCAHLPKPVDVVRLAEVLVALRHERLRLRGGSPAVAPAD